MSSATTAAAPPTPVTAAAAGLSGLALSGTSDTTEQQLNPRGIPVAPFIQNVEEYVSANGGSEGVEGVMRKFQELISKYSYMESSSTRRLAGLRNRIPDLEQTLEMVTFLKSRYEQSLSAPRPSSSSSSTSSSTSTESSSILETTFELHDTLYARANIDTSKCGEVYIWLGANVMLSYPIDEAVQLLTEKLNVAVTNIRNCEDDLDFLREQITTLEVAVARVYNWDVINRRSQGKSLPGAKA